MNKEIPMTNAGEEVKAMLADIAKMICAIGDALDRRLPPGNEQINIAAKMSDELIALRAEVTAIRRLSQREADGAAFRAASIAEGSRRMTPSLKGLAGDDAVGQFTTKLHDTLRAYVIKLRNAPVTGMFEYVCSLCDHYWRANTPEDHAPGCLADLAAMSAYHDLMKRGR